MANDTYPTYENQLKSARALAKEQGISALQGHKDIGRMCGCKDCFCCAALEVYRELTYSHYQDPYRDKEYTE
jgi:hypothetical protein